MKIGIFTDTFYPEVNGVVTSVQILKKELNKLGHKVYIFTTTNPAVKRPEVEVFRLPSMPFIFLPSRRVGMMYSPVLARAIMNLGLDIIHTQTEFSLGFFGKLMARRAGIPVIHTYHTMYKDFVHYISKGKFVRTTNEVAKVFSRKYCNGCNAVIAPTVKVYDLLREYGVDRPIKIIPTGIDLEPFRKTSHDPEDILKLRSELGIGKDDPVLLFIGRIAKEKSIDVVMRQLPMLLQRLPSVKFLLVGDGPLRKDLQEMARRLNIQNSVIFAGEQPWKSIGRYYQLGDVFVSASVTETQGLTFIEAMAAGLPVVAKMDKSILALIEDGVTGRVFEKEEDLPGILCEVFTNKEKTDEIIRNGYEKIDEFSAGRFARNVEQAYLEVLEGAMGKKTEVSNAAR